MGKEDNVKRRPLGKVFRDANFHGFSFISSLDTSAEKIAVGKCVVVESDSEYGTIIAEINSRTEAKDDYFCECKSMIFIDKNGTPVDVLPPPLLSSPVFAVGKIEITKE
ncbi:hypothetical protein KAW43_03440 [Candidatus Parcubacteria bacterium]|nr:hypothetical protein [Candidatus Parcubacteria bacterium]